MKQQVFNPYLPSWEYVPDGEPHIFGDRLYIYGSHDRFNARTYCMEPYVCWSAPINDLSDWTNHGIIYTGEDDILNDTKKHLMFAPDAVEYRSKYYLFYGLDTSNTISVAISDIPEGPFTFYGNVHHKDGGIWGLKEGDYPQFDPCVFKDDDGSVYLYSGFSSTPEVIERIKKKIHDPSIELNISTIGNWVVQLEEDMLTLKTQPKMLLPGVSNSAGTGFEGHEFFEASSMRKYNGLYYAIYSSVNGHELCYAMSEYPDRDFVYKGVLHSNGNIGIDEEPSYYYANNHGSLVKILDDYYVFGHRHTHYTQYQRQGVAELLHMREDGTFSQAEMTSCGLNKGPLISKGTYPSYIACVLKSKEGACKADVTMDKKLHPAITQNVNKESFITNLQDGSIVGFKYFDMQNVQKISLCVISSEGCKIYVKRDLCEEPCACIVVDSCEEWECFESDIIIRNSITALYFVIHGNTKLQFKSFTLD